MAQSTDWLKLIDQILESMDEVRINVRINTNPGNAERNAAGLNAGKSVGPHNDMNGSGDHVRNGADGGMMLPKCDAGDRRLVVGGDGEHRRFLMSATIVTVFQSNLTITKFV